MADLDAVRTRRRSQELEQARHQAENAADHARNLAAHAEPHVS
ncbi:hypothetical protein AB0N87_37800 [Streptomyces sp. NPDC093228]